MNIIVDASGNVLMYSENAKPTPPAGASLVTLDAPKAAALLNAQKVANDGLKFDGTNFTTVAPSSGGGK